jgi:hypothetical protein
MRIEAIFAALAEVALKMVGFSSLAAVLIIAEKAKADKIKICLSMITRLQQIHTSKISK